MGDSSSSSASSASSSSLLIVEYLRKECGRLRALSPASGQPPASRGGRGSKAKQPQQQDASSSTPRDWSAEFRTVVLTLRKTFGVRTSFSQKHPNLVLLKYAQVDAKFDELMVQECRGIILDIADNFKVVSFPFRKFFNVGERWAHEIEWTGKSGDDGATDENAQATTPAARVLEKLDGSLCVLYWYDNTWNVSSSGVADASGNLQGAGCTFAGLFWAVWRRCGYALPVAESDREFCFMFEMVTPENIIVVRPERERMVLIGVRSLKEPAFQEFEPEEFGKRLGWAVVASVPLSSLDAVETAARSLNPVAAEGFVVVDRRWNRVKVKAPQYVALSHLQLSSNPNHVGNIKNLLNIARHREEGEFLAYFPAHRRNFEDVSLRLNRLKERLTRDFVRLAALMKGGEADASEDDEDDSDRNMALDSWQPLANAKETAHSREIREALDRLKIWHRESRNFLTKVAEKVFKVDENRLNVPDDTLQSEVAEFLQTMPLDDLYSLVEHEKKLMPVEDSSSDEDVENMSRAQRRQAGKKAGAAQKNQVTKELDACPESDENEPAAAIKRPAGSNRSQRKGQGDPGQLHSSDDDEDDWSGSNNQRGGAKRGRGRKARR